MILDSTFLVDVLRSAESVHELVANIDPTGTPFVSTITIKELFEGICLSDASDAERSAVRELLEDVNEIPFDREIAFQAGEINARLVSNGEPIDETDVQIGATALVHGYPVVTRNVDHFERLDGLDVVTY